MGVNFEVEQKIISYDELNPANLLGKVEFKWKAENYALKASTSTSLEAFIVSPSGDVTSDTLHKLTMRRFFEVFIRLFW